MNLSRVSILGLCAISALSHAQSWHFNIDQSKTGVDGKIRFESKLTGNLIGDWDATTNPTGTMTKPGWKGDWGSDENIAVKLNPKLCMGATAKMMTSGGFDMKIDKDAKKVDVTNYSADLMAGGPLLLTSKFFPNHEGFKTKNPTGRFKKKEDQSIPGHATLDKFLVTQSGATIRSFLAKPKEGDFLIPIAVIPVHVELNFKDDQGVDYPIAFDSQYLVCGKLVVDSSGNANLSGKPERGKSEVKAEINKILDPFTVNIKNEKGEAGHIKVSLNMKKICFGAEGLRSFSADGVPSP